VTGCTGRPATPPATRRRIRAIHRLNPPQSGNHPCAQHRERCPRDPGNGSPNRPGNVRPGRRGNDPPRGFGTRLPLRSRRRLVRPRRQRLLLPLRKRTSRRSR
jgi:hypothetical protein